MSGLAGKQFGVLIAYVLPGFVALWGVSLFSPTVAGWIAATPAGAPAVAGFVYVTLASVGVGLTVSAIRWAIVDTFHHRTGIGPPAWDFESLNGKLEAFEGLIENHYRYYQFYSNMFVAVALACAMRVYEKGGVPGDDFWTVVGFLLLECVLLAGSRDALAKCYRRAERLLGTLGPENGSFRHDERVSQERSKAGKPQTGDGQGQVAGEVGDGGEESSPR